MFLGGGAAINYQGGNCAAGARRTAEAEKYSSLMAESVLGGRGESGIKGLEACRAFLRLAAPRVRTRMGCRRRRRRQRPRYLRRSSRQQAGRSLFRVFREPRHSLICVWLFLYPQEQDVAAVGEGRGRCCMVNFQSVGPSGGTSEKEEEGVGKEEEL